jgi:PAS domain S-box-containing protein
VELSNRNHHWLPERRSSGPAVCRLCPWRCAPKTSRGHIPSSKEKRGVQQQQSTANRRSPSERENETRLGTSTSSTEDQDHTGGVFVVMTDADASDFYNYDEDSSFIENSHAPIFGVNTNGDINLWNNMSSELLGFSRPFVLGKSLVDSFIDPFFRLSVQAVLDVALDGNGTANYELEFQTQSGQTRYLLANISARRNSSGQVTGVVVLAQDVTESAQNDRAVAATARELRQLVDTANAPIFGVDTAGRVNEWNDKTAEITGFSGDEAFNQPLVETFIVPTLQPSVQQVLFNALRGRATSNFELEIRTKSNETRYLLVNATTRRDAENNVVGVVCIAQDVTEACKHDRAVAAMANELRQLIDTANAPIFGIDRDG